MVESVDRIFLRPDLDIRSGYQDERGNAVWHIYDPVQDSFYSISEGEYEVLRRLGHQGSEEIIKALTRLGFSDIKSLVNDTVSFLRNNFLLLPVPGITDKIIERRSRKSQGSWLFKILYAYIFFRIPLCKPDRFFTRLTPLLSAVFNRWHRLLLYIFSAIGYITVLFHWNRYSRTIEDSLSWSSLLPVFTVIFFIKIFHELAHGFTAKVYQVKIKSIGLAFILFMPRFYTDITDAWKLTDRRQRMNVDAAGIILELVTGGICAFIWCFSQGALAQVCFYIFTVSVFNTLFINGNPLMRFDGYYLLMDFCNIRNLRQKGVAAFRSLCHRFILGRKEQTVHDWPNTFILLYGVLSYMYKIFIYTCIIMFIYHKFSKFIAIVFIILEMGLLVVIPLIRETKILLKSVQNIFRFLISVLIIAGLISLLFIPFNQSVRLPCEIKSAKSTPLYSMGAGYVRELADSEKVEKGAIVIRLENQTLLDLEKNYELEHRLILEEIEILGQSVEELTKIEILKNKLKGLLTKKRAVKEKIELLTLKASESGQIFIDERVMLDQWCNQSALIGEIYDAESLYASALIHEELIGDIKAGQTVYFQNGAQQILGKVVSISLKAVQDVGPSPLYTPWGGKVEARLTTGESATLTESYYQVQVSLEGKSLSPGRTIDASIKVESSIVQNFLKKLNQWF